MPKNEDDAPFHGDSSPKEREEDKSEEHQDEDPLDFRTLLSKFKSGKMFVKDDDGKGHTTEAFFEASFAEAQTERDNNMSRKLQIQLMECGRITATQILEQANVLMREGGPDGSRLSAKEAMDQAKMMVETAVETQKEVALANADTALKLTDEIRSRREKEFAMMLKFMEQQVILIQKAKMAEAGQYTDEAYMDDDGADVM